MNHEQRSWPNRPGAFPAIQIKTGMDRALLFS